MTWRGQEAYTGIMHISYSDPVYFDARMSETDVLAYLERMTEGVAVDVVETSRAAGVKQYIFIFYERDDEPCGKAM